MRTTIALVKSVIPTGLEDPEISALMQVANRMVTTVVGSEGSLTEETLKDLETWMTAHIIAIGKERQTREERVGDVWVKYNENKSQFLQSTSYGQMVLFLDTTGKFQSASKMRASIQSIKQEED
jgi:hypothetical protein